MRPMFVCTRCQLKARLHSHIRALQQARRGFASPVRQQDGSERRALPAGGGRYSGQRQQVDRHSTQASPGRYSGRTLEPEAVLSELDHAQHEEKTGKDVAGNGSRRQQKSPTTQIHVGPIARLKFKLERFRNFATLQHAEAGRVLQEIAADPNRDKLGYALSDDHRFCRALSGYLQQTCRMVVEHNPEPESRLWAMMTPSELIRAGQTLGLSAFIKDRHVETMWRIAARLVELRPAVRTDPNVRPWHDDLLHELVTLWNIAFESKLRRQGPADFKTYEPRSGPPNAPIDWSFLPVDTGKLFDNWGPTSRTSNSFENAIQLILPSHRWKSNPKTSQHYDYTSAALVTLDELRLRARSTDGLYAELWKSYRPLMSFFADILKRHPNTSMAGALAETMKSPANQEFEAMVERLNLQWTASDDVRPSQQAQQIDELQNPARAQENPHSPASADVSEDVKDPILEPSSETAPSASETVTSDSLNHEGPSDANGELTTTLETATTPGVTPLVSKEQDFGRHTAFVDNQLKWLGKAWQEQSLQRALRCKDDILAMARKPEGNDLPNKIFEHLMLTLLALRNPQEALAIWNFFIGDLDRQPTAQTYTVMMRGAQYVRDIKAMEAFWTKMRNAGIRPDAHAWSTRLFGLIKAHKTDLALKAMDDLGKEWARTAGAQRSSRSASKSVTVDVEAAKENNDDADSAAKPNVVIMNAAISALANKNDRLVPQVLRWGRRFGLEPDLVTYNVLLNLSMRHSNADEAVSILKRMSEKGVDPNSQTWTILLTAMFEGEQLDKLDHDQQQARVMSFIASLEEVTNVAIDQKGYALVMDRLLTRHGNSAAADAVLQHMISRNVHPTTHILTILMRSYFQRQPEPDFAAAEGLWNRIMNTKSGFNVNLDSIFYDRMVEWYAQYHSMLGSTQKMMQFLDRMLKEKRRPSWRAMEYAVRALAERKEWLRFDEMVFEARKWVKDDDTEIVVGHRSYGQREFWQFVMNTGRLREEGIASADQIMRRKTGAMPMERRMYGVVR